MTAGKARIRKVFCSCLAALALFSLAGTPARAAAAPVREKLLAMTFDDGPNGSITPKLLDDLAARGVKCTFFLLGENANRYPDLVRRIYSEGHQVANHTWHHYALSKQSDSVIRNEVEATRSLLESLVGQRDFMVRLPYGDGMTSDRVRSQIYAPIISWSVDSSNGGRATGSESTLYSGIINSARDGSIILMHDFNEANRSAALRAIDTLRGQGYSFVTVEELFRLRNAEPWDNAVYARVDFAGTGYDESRLSQHWAYPFLTQLNNLGILTGDGAGLKPNDYLTRAEAAALLWRVSGMPEGTPADAPAFGDVPADAWYAQAVSWGWAAGAIEGYSEDVFAPMDPVSREQFCALLLRLAHSQGLEVPQGAAIPAYSDASLASGWAVSTLDELWAAGFVSQNEASVFRPGDSATRAEAAELICWYMSLTPGGVYKT